MQWRSQFNLNTQRDAMPLHIAGGTYLAFYKRTFTEQHTNILQLNHSTQTMSIATSSIWCQWRCSDTVAVCGFLCVVRHIQSAFVQFRQHAVNWNIFIIVANLFNIKMGRPSITSYSSMTIRPDIRCGERKDRRTPSSGSVLLASSRFNYQTY